MEKINSGKFMPLDLPIALFLISAAVAVIPAYDPSLCWGPLAVLGLCGAGYYAISRVANNSATILRIANAGVFFGGIISLYFITQFPHYASLDKLEPISQLARGFGKIFPAFPFWTPSANSMATFLEGLFILAIGVYLVNRGFFWKLAAGTAGALIGLALLISESRGALLAIFLAGIVWASLYFRLARWLALVVALGLALLVGIVIVKGDINVLGQIPVVDRTLAPLFIRPDRLDVYRGSLSLIQDMPFTGIGLGGQFAMNYSRYVLLIYVPYLYYSHNLYLEVWLQQGLLGMTAWVWLMVILFFSVRKVFKSGKNILYESTWVGLLAILLHGVTDASMYVDWWSWAPFFGLLALNSAQLFVQNPNMKVFQAKPALVTGGFLLATLLSIPSISAAWAVNVGSLAQARADLASGLSTSYRTDLYNSAQTAFENAFHQAPSFRPANSRLGLTYLAEDRFQNAAYHLETAYQVDYSNVSVIKSLGLAYIWVGKTIEGAKLLADMPQIVQELNWWGWYRENKNQADLAQNAYTASLLIDPDQDGVRDLLASLKKSN